MLGFIEKELIKNVHVRINHSNIRIHHEKPLIGTKINIFTKHSNKKPEIVSHELLNSAMTSEEFLKLFGSYSKFVISLNPRLYASYIHHRYHRIQCRRDIPVKVSSSGDCKSLFIE